MNGIANGQRKSEIENLVPTIPTTNIATNSSFHCSLFCIGSAYQDDGVRDVSERLTRENKRP